MGINAHFVLGYGMKQTLYPQVGDSFSEARAPASKGALRHTETTAKLSTLLC